VEEVQYVLYHGIYNRFIGASDIVHIYVNADRRIEDKDIQVADWIMTELGPVITDPGPVSLSVILDPWLLHNFFYGRVYFLLLREDHSSRRGHFAST